MTNSRKKTREEFVDFAEALGGSIQFEFYGCVLEIVERRYPERQAKKLAAALSNYVFRFGLIVPEHAADNELLGSLAAEYKICLNSFGEKFKANATGVLILLAAAWKIEIGKYKNHMQELADYGFLAPGGGMACTRFR